MNGGGTSIRNSIFVGKWSGLYPRGLKTGGGLKLEFTVIKVRSKGS